MLNVLLITILNPFSITQALVLPHAIKRSPGAHSFVKPNIETLHPHPKNMEPSKYENMMMRKAGEYGGKIIILMPRKSKLEGILTKENKTIEYNKTNELKSKYLDSKENFIDSYKGKLDNKNPLSLFPHYVNKNSQLVKTEQDDDNKIEKLQGYFSNNALRSSIYDSKGRIYLTEPIDEGNREFNALLNKVVEYKIGSDQGYLRKPSSVKFSEDEVEQLKDILRHIKHSESLRQPKRTPKSVFEFSDLVL